MQVLNGFVKIHRKLLQWGWYQDNVVKGVFLHLLLTAAFRDSQWMGRTIKRGQVVVGMQKMADELGFTRQQVRTAINKLKSTNEITTETTNKYTIVTVVNWEEYQLIDETPTNKTTNTLTNEQPTNNQQITNKQPHRKNVKNVKNVKNDKKDILYCSEQNFAHEPKVIGLPLNNGTDYEVYNKDVIEWQGLYQSVDVMQELRTMRGWLIANPKKRKTKSGIQRFVNGWLAREQNKYKGHQEGTSESSNPFLNMLEDERNIEL